jgi:hypothetical protein
MRYALNGGMSGNARTFKSPEAVGEEQLRQLLRFGGNHLPGDFLRQQGLNPAALVAQGLLQPDGGRWSEGYVAGPRLRPSR